VRRLRRDVLALAGLRAIIVFEGTNDIAANDPPVSPDELTAGYRTVIDAAHARGVKVIGTTLTPASGDRFPGHASPGAAAIRATTNTWIRTGGAFDGVADADRALRDPGGAEALADRFDSGDGLHPDDAGMRAIAAAVPLASLPAATCSAR
jgi:lysophospholipase L1-like esterase